MLKEKLIDIAQKHLPDENHYLVDVLISEKAGKKLVSVLVDGDQGVNIQTCADMSRAISEELEAEDIIEDAFVLEVSSPGVDFPLKTLRQYRKNLNRDILVTLGEGKEVLGTLLKVDDSGIRLNAKEKAKGKSKKIVTKEVEIPFSEIIKSIVQISFK